MNDYKWRAEGGETVTCDSCYFPAPLAEFERGPSRANEAPKPPRLLCAFCSNTLASRHTEYPARNQQEVLHAEIWRAAASVFNMIKFGDGCAEEEPK